MTYRARCQGLRAYKRRMRATRFCKEMGLPIVWPMMGQDDSYQFTMKSYAWAWAIGGPGAEQTGDKP